MKSVRLTPLNFASAFLLVLAVYPLFFGSEYFGKGLSTMLLLVLVLMCTISDILFRSFLRNLKRIWLIELLFVAFIVILLLIIHSF